MVLGRDRRDRRRQLTGCATASSRARPLGDAPRCSTQSRNHAASSGGHRAPREVEPGARTPAHHGAPRCGLIEASSRPVEQRRRLGRGRRAHPPPPRAAAPSPLPTVHHASDKRRLDGSGRDVRPGGAHFCSSLVIRFKAARASPQAGPCSPSIAGISPRFASRRSDAARTASRGQWRAPSGSSALERFRATPGGRGREQYYRRVKDAGDERITGHCYRDGFGVEKDQRSAPFPRCGSTRRSVAGRARFITAPARHLRENAAVLRRLGNGRGVAA